MFDFSCEALVLMLKETRQCFLVTGKDGEIYWANESFLRWSNYTISELKNLGWKEISVNDISMQADLDALQRCVNEEITSYSIRKKYIPKNERSEWGDLIVTRYPSKGEVQYFICEWIPLKNGTAAAFSLAMNKIESFKETITVMNTKIEEIIINDSRPTSRKMIESIHDWCVENPKKSLTILAILAGLIGVNNLTDIIFKFIGTNNIVP